ncbi:hypothetical protein AAFF_G00435430 [Aldrovandia affinis]|uniref:Uncharacterized protein n=1 Tax=Aldrovandia affinis TaxID=143900 RepID=A0AAD7S8E2_9TELE|nr:hypothetical protein AAFF_G00435430 [Aldrovandia affinis]
MSCPASGDFLSRPFHVCGEGKRPSLRLAPFWRSSLLRDVGAEGEGRTVVLRALILRAGAGSYGDGLPLAAFKSRCGTEDTSPPSAPPQVCHPSSKVKVSWECNAIKPPQLRRGLEGCVYSAWAQFGAHAPSPQGYRKLLSERFRAKQNQDSLIRSFHGGREEGAPGTANQTGQALSSTAH